MGNSAFTRWQVRPPGGRDVGDARIRFERVLARGRSLRAQASPDLRRRGQAFRGATHAWRRARRPPSQVGCSALRSSSRSPVVGVVLCPALSGEPDRALLRLGASSFPGTTIRCQSGDRFSWENLIAPLRADGATRSRFKGLPFVEPRGCWSFAAAAFPPHKRGESGLLHGRLRCCSWRLVWPVIPNQAGLVP